MYYVHVYIWNIYIVYCCAIPNGMVGEVWPRLGTSNHHEHLEKTNKLVSVYNIDRQALSIAFRQHCNTQTLFIHWCGCPFCTFSCSVHYGRREEMDPMHLNTAVTPARELWTLAIRHVLLYLHLSFVRLIWMIEIYRWTKLLCCWQVIVLSLHF